MNYKVKDFVKSNICYFIVAFVSAMYILKSLIEVDESGKTIEQIIADSATVFFLGIFINRILSLQGLRNGDKDEKVVNTVRLHGEIVTEISPHIHILDKWCEYRTAQTLKELRTKVLLGCAMKYDDYFDENGVGKTFVVNKEKLKDKYARKDELKRRFCYQRAVRLKITPLSSNSLTTDCGRENDPFDFGKNKAQHEKSEGLKDTFSKVITGILFGYFGFRLIENFTYASLIWAALTVAFLLIMGIVKMYQSYFYMVDNFRSGIIRKINNLQMFQNYIANLKQETLKEEKTGGEENGIKKTTAVE